MLDASVESMTDWAEMPAPSPEVVAEGTARLSEAERAEMIETARDAYVLGVRGKGRDPLRRHDALWRLEAAYATTWALRMAYPAIFGVSR